MSLHNIMPALLVLLLASCASKPVPVLPVVEVRRALPVVQPLVFALAEWDAPAPEENIAGYWLELGDAPGHYVGRIKLDWIINLHRMPSVPVLHNHPLTVARLYAYGPDGTESLPTPEAQWPMQNELP